MSVFTSLITATLDVPTDPGQTITIRKLAPKHLDAARRASLVSAREQMRDLSADQDLLEQVRVAMTEGSADTPSQASKAVSAAAADPMNGLDPLVLIQHGVVGWTYPMERSMASYEDLDEETRDWLAEQVLRLARPSLFVAAAAEDEQKKAHGALPTA